MATRIVGRERRKLRIRKKIGGTAVQPRLTVFRTAKHIYAQVIDDSTGRTLAHVSTLSKDLKGSLDEGNKTEAAKKVGALVAKICLSKKIDKVEARIDWTASAEEVERQVRAFNPVPGAWFEANGERIKLLEAQIEQGDSRFRRNDGLVLDDALLIQ